MGCGIEFLKWLSATDRIPPRGRLLDIGESCLLAATLEDIEYVLGRHGCALDPEHLRPLAEALAVRSNTFGQPFVQTLFLGDVLRLTQVEYVSFDVVSAWYADLFDLNTHSLARESHNTFDVVLNFGTTEHLINQYNAFKVMHEACKPGGYMFHQVPSTGYVNHGYFCYNALMFKELAEANEYDIVDLWFYGPNGAGGNVLVNGDHFPGVLDPGKLRNNVDALRAAEVANALINVLYRKTSAGEFRVGLEVKTAAAAHDAHARYTSPYIAGSNSLPRPGTPPGLRAAG